MHYNFIVLFPKCVLIMNFNDMFTPQAVWPLLLSRKRTEYRQINSKV